jgi:hypothetical protein
MLSVLGLPGRAFVGSWAFLVATAIESKKSQDAPNVRGLGAGRMIVEHAALHAPVLQHDYPRGQPIVQGAFACELRRLPKMASSPHMGAHLPII